MSETGERPLWTTDFRRLWWGEAVSFFGSQLTLFAIPIVALTHLHASAAEVAWLTAASGVGTLLFLGAFGPWTDRGRRTRFMSSLSLLRSAALGVVVVLLLTDHLSMLVLAVAIAVISGLTGLYESAFSALVPTIVDRSRLTSANSWVAGIRSAGDIGAGAAAGALLQLLSPVVLFLADAISYLVSALSVAGVRDHPARAIPRQTFGEYTRSLGNGMRTLRRSPIMWPTTLAIAHFNLFTSAIQAVYLVHALRSGSMSPVEVGIAGTIGGCIGLASTALAPLVWRRYRPALVLTATFCFPAASAIGIAALDRAGGLLNVALLGVSLGSWASCVMINIAGTETLKQLTIPETEIGNVSAASRILTWGIDPVGAALAGVLALLFPTAFILVVGAAGVVASCVWVLASPHLRALRMLTEAVPLA
ncbi:MFS transporter [Leifsonia sp. AG29]|uniref:MFS transporter n=1 Tax=Leifsonia sp. AG29 TaxID=2598860 RepID=UPI00131A83BE|nr:MFS transporter [Leifsonia sp. AG29]